MSPRFISMVVNAQYNIVDQIFIGQGVGYLGNGATNVVLPLTVIVIALSLLIGDGAAAYLSLKLGETDLPYCFDFGNHCISTGIFVFQFAPMIIVRLFGSESDLYNEFAVNCFKVFLLACPINGLQMLLHLSQRWSC